MNVLHPYQNEGVDFLSARRFALLADEMGVGKTPQAICAADEIFAERVLVVCPAIARVNWQREFAVWAKIPRKYAVVVSENEHPPAGHSIICSFEYATKFHSRLMGPWDAVIIDEVHFANNMEAQRTAAIYGKRGGKAGAAGGLIYRTSHFWGLSGTPAPNHWGELWTMLRCFGATTLSYEGFILRYCEVKNTNYGLKVIRGRQDRAHELRAMLARFMLRRKKMDVLKDLPPISFSDYLVEPGPIDFDTDASLIGYVFPTDRKAEFFAKLESERKLVEGMVTHTGLGKDGLTALAGVSDSVSTLRRYLGLQKVEPVAELIRQELEAGAYEKKVIFGIHQGVIEGLRAKLAKFKPVTLYGGTPPDKRQKNIDKFQKDPKCRLFIANIKAAGTAVTLTAAHHVDMVEQEWAPGHNEQAVMRCHRIGQKNPVTVRFISTTDPLEVRIANILKRKTRDAAAILD